MKISLDDVLSTLVLIAAILFIAGFLFGCSVTAQTPPPPRFVWTLSDSPGIISQSIYCGTESQTYTGNYVIPNGTTTEQEVAPLLAALNIPDGMIYCAMTASNFSAESIFSNEINFQWANGQLIQGKPNAPTGLYVL